MRRSPVLTEALGFLRDYRRSAALIVFLGALGAGIVMAARSLESGGRDAQPALAMPDIPSAGSALMWSGEAVAPSTTQAHSLGELLGLLSGLAWLGFAIAGFSVLSTYAAQMRRRTAEGTIRRAVGASLQLMLRAMLLEAAMLVAAGLAIGWGGARALLILGARWWPGAVHAAHVGGELIVLMLGTVTAAGVLACFVRIRARAMTDAEAEPTRLRVPTCQVAASVALLLLAAALFQRPEATPSDVSAMDDGRLVLNVDSGIADPAERATRYAALLRSFASRPDAGRVDRIGVASASTAGAPAASAGNANLVSAGLTLGLGTVNDIIVECGGCRPIPFPQVRTVLHAIGPSTLNGTGARLVAGRLFTEHDDMSAPRVAIVNRMLANQHFLGGNAIGRSIYPGSELLGGGYRIIGVVDDDRSSVVGGAELPRETAYVSVLQRPPQVVDLVLDGDGATAGRDAASRAIANVVGPQATIRRIQTMADQMQGQRAAILWCGGACVVIAILILLVALVGTIATMTMWAESMAHELALRRAVGAPRWRILAFVFARAMGVGIGGAVFGGYVYASALAPVLAISVAHLALPALSTVLWIVIPPVLLAVVIGTIPGARFAWGAPAAGLADVR